MADRCRPHTKKTKNHIVELDGRMFRLRPARIAERCSDCALEQNMKAHDRHDCAYGLKRVYCLHCAYIYERIDPLYQDLLKVKEKDDGKA